MDTSVQITSARDSLTYKEFCDIDGYTEPRVLSPSSSARTISIEHGLSHHATPDSKTPRESLLAYAILFLLGVGNMLPWNAFITAQSYFASRFCGTIFANSFENFFSISYTLAQPLGLLVSLFYGHKIPMISQIRIPLIIYAILFGLTTILVTINMETSILFGLTLICTFLCGFTGAIMNGGLFGIAGLLPAKYTSALMLGSAQAGLLISVASFITRIATIDLSNCSEDDDYYSSSGSVGCSSFAIDDGAIAYFCLSTIVIFICQASFEIFVHLPFLK